MSEVITAGSTITCQHRSKVTPVTGAVSDLLQVAGHGVLVGELTDSTIAGCPQVGNNQTPCTTVDTQTAGASTVLFVGEDPVLLSTATGTTNGVPGNQWSVSQPGQQFLTTTEGGG